MAANAQKFDWVSFQPHVNQVANAGSSIVATAIDNQGFIYTVGFFDNNIIVGVDTLTKLDAQPNTVITKWNQSGQPVAYKQYHFFANYYNLARDIKFDATSNQIVVSHATYWPASQVKIIGIGSTPDTTITLASSGINLMRFNLNLEYQSSASPGGSFGQIDLGKITVKDGAVYTTEANSHAINKISAQNTLVWSKTSSNIAITDIAITPQDTIYVVGRLTSALATSVSLGNNTINFGSPSNNDKVFVFKLDTAGNVIQGRFLAQLHFEADGKIAVDAQGNPYIFCPYNQQLVIIGGDTLNINPQGTDAFVAKMKPDLSADLQWITEFSDNGTLGTGRLFVHPSGSVFITGNYGGNATFGQFTMPFASQPNSFFAQLNIANGDILFAQNFGKGNSKPLGLANIGSKYYIGGLSAAPITASPGASSYGCFTQTEVGHFLTCFNDTAQPLPQTNFSYIREQNKIYFNSDITSGQFVSIDFGDGTSTTTQVNPTHVYGKGFFNAVLTTKFDCFEKKDTLKILFKGIQKVLPEKIANNQLQMVFAKGGFPFPDSTGVAVKLKRGNVVLNTTSISVADSGLIQANYLLSNEALGFYDVIVTGPGGFADTLISGIEMVPEKTALPELQILGPQVRLINRITPYQIIVSNPSNVIQFGVPVYIALQKNNQIVRLSNKVIADSVANTIRNQHFTNDFIMAYDSLSNDSIWLGVFVIPFIYPGASEVIDFYVRGTTLGDKGLFVVAGKPMYDSTQLDLLGLRTSCDFLADPAACVFDLLGQIPGVSCVTNALSAGCALGNLARDITGGRNKTGDVGRYAGDIFNLVADVSGVLTCEAKDVFGVSDFLEDKLTSNVVNFVFGNSASLLSQQTPSIPLPGGFSVPGSCGDAFGKKGFTGGFKSLDEFTEQRFFFKDASSIDPNIKIGPVGNEPENYFYGQSKVNYTIYFENLNSATAPATSVEIFDTLDVNFFDISTLQFTGFGFNDVRYHVMHSSDSYVQEIDLRPAKNTIVRFEAKLDSISHSLVWKFSSFHPQTRDLVSNVSDGFLNPNVTSPEGEGYVSFSILPKPNRLHLQQILNRAKIVFDENAPLFTDYWTNTVDKVKPSSNVLPLASVISDTLFSLKWSGNDAHSGVKHYSIFYTLNDTATYLFANNTAADSALFKGDFGNTYKFYSIATDYAGNKEGVPNTPDAVVTLQQPTTSVINERENSNGLIMYPNPANNKVYIEINAPQAANQESKIEILDIQGKVLIVATMLDKTTLDISQLSSAVYQVRVVNTNSATVKRLVKE